MSKLLNHFSMTFAKVLNIIVVNLIGVNLSPATVVTQLPSMVSNLALLYFLT